ncbi:MAG TPA: lipopolysaccharide assembly protein LapA domain-containing protein, partial [Rickettsiales bacterium]|nr:lipopolysaccharide assembly protein LapA domain-containing protein [Rickettsiales bacterium]
LLLACIVIFMVNNRQMVTVEMFPLPIIIETRLFMLMALCFLLGILLGFFIFTTNHLKSLFSRSKNQQKDKENS